MAPWRAARSTAAVVYHDTVWYRSQVLMFFSEQHSPIVGILPCLGGLGHTKVHCRMVQHIETDRMWCVQSQEWWAPVGGMQRIRKRIRATSASIAPRLTMDRAHGLLLYGVRR